MSSESQVDLSQIEQTRMQINRLIEEVARLGEQDLPPGDYYREFLQRALAGIAAPAGAVWTLNPQGNLLMQSQLNVRQLALDRNEAARQGHDELLRQATVRGEPFMVPPHAALEAPAGALAASNPTDYMTMIAPIRVDKQVAGVLEVWQDADRNPLAMRGFLQFLVVMSDLAGVYIRNQRSRQMQGQQQLLIKLEGFLRQIHGSLNPTEVAYYVSNEGRKLVECDRISVAQRVDRKTSVLAISGADVVEKRSNLVQLMRELFDAVLQWGERLVYNGVKDDSLPPDVLLALDDYLAESNSKLLVVHPLRDDRETESKYPGRAALMMECFEPSGTPDLLISRLEVIGKHSTSALYNAIEHERTPLRFLWKPLAKFQDGLGGKTRAIIWSCVGVATLILLAMIFVPYPLKMDAKGNLLPQERRWVYAPLEGRVERFDVEPGQDVFRDDYLALMYDVTLEMKLRNLEKEKESAENEYKALQNQLLASTHESERDKLKISHEIRNKRNILDLKTRELESLKQRNNCVNERPGFYYLKAPINGTILNSDYRENLTNRFVKQSDPVLRVGNKQGPWEVELKIPQKHIGQVLQAFEGMNSDYELDVDILLLSSPTQVFKGKLNRSQISGEAVPNRDAHDESEPVVLVVVRIDGDDIAPGDMIPDDLKLTGTEVHAKIRCGNHAMGYSLFYGVWEFLYEKVIFFF